MPDQELLDDVLEALEQSGGPVKNPVLRQALGWEESIYEAVKGELVAPSARRALPSPGLRLPRHHRGDDPQVPRCARGSQHARLQQVSQAPPKNLDGRE